VQVWRAQLPWLAWCIRGVVVIRATAATTTRTGIYAAVYPTSASTSAATRLRAEGARWQDCSQAGCCPEGGARPKGGAGKARRQ